MSILVLQIIIKQWDKGQRTSEHVEERAKRPNQYPLIFPPAIYVFDRQCVVDQHGDDLLGNRLNYSQSTIDIIQLDRFQISMSKQSLEYVAQPGAESRIIGSLDNIWIQCKYDWRYGVDEGGFYYWLYEEITLNAIYMDTLNEDVFMRTKPERIVML